jgi:hypothetical protein
MGGLLVKQLLRTANDGLSSSFERKLVQNTKGVCFIATPHIGSELAKWVKYFQTLLGTNVSVDELRPHEPLLRDLKEWYRNFVTRPETAIRTLAFAEMKPIPVVGLIVAPGDANPDVHNVPCYPLDEDHRSICKPRTPNAEIHLKTISFVKDCLNSESVPPLNTEPTNQQRSQPVPTLERSPEPMSLFYSYSHKDEALRKKLETHLSLLQNQGVIRGWHDRRIEAGTEWDGVISENLEHAAIILLLVSADFLASKYCCDVEIKRAMERHDAGTARVIPVILRSVDWHTAPFGKLQALPTDGKPVTSWKNRDEAFTNVARGIREAVKDLTSGAQNVSAPARPAVVMTSPPAAQAPAVDRAALVRTVSGLSPGDMALLVTMVEGAASHVSRHGTVPEQAAELIGWAESSTGAGLDVIREALNFR